MTAGEISPLEEGHETVLEQGPGYHILMSSMPRTLVPFPPAEHDEGINHGWIDLRGRPDLVASVPEAARSKGLAELLRAIADPASELMTGGCECGLFESETDGVPPLYVGSYVDVMFKDAHRNADPQNLVDLATSILAGVRPSADHFVMYDLIIEPLKAFFGRRDCFSLMIRPMGFGSTEASAWAAFDEATRAVARAIENGR